MKQGIGFIDSGIGGLSLRTAMIELLPFEQITYIADEAFSPYGEKTAEVILKRCQLLTDELIQKKCKVVVLACNTATTQVINQLRQDYSIPFVGIEPAIKPAVLGSKTGVIGVLATKGTLNSQLFHQNSLSQSKKITIVEQVGTGLIECVENGKINDESTKNLLRSFLTPMIEKGIDRLVLGCTHYPFLEPVIQKIVPPEVEIIDNSRAVIQQLKRILTEQGNLELGFERPKHLFFSTKTNSRLKNFLEKDEEFNFLSI